MTTPWNVVIGAAMWQACLGREFKIAGAHMSGKGEKGRTHEPAREDKKNDDASKTDRKWQDTTRYFTPTPLPDEPEESENSDDE
jgi:hypothetical protein